MSSLTVMGDNVITYSSLGQHNIRTPICQAQRLSELLMCLDLTDTGRTHYNERVTQGDSHMNLTDVNSPVELVLENERQLTPLQRALQALQNDHIGAGERLEIARALIEQVRSFHNYVIETRDDLTVQWSIDAQTLMFVTKMLETVEL